MSLSYSAKIIRGTSGGAAISTDAVPSVGSPPLAANVARVELRGGAEAPPQKLWLMAGNGTTITATAWVFDATMNLWLQLGSMTATPSAPGSLVIPNILGASLFLQVTGNTGVTVFGAGWN